MNLFELHAEELLDEKKLNLLRISPHKQYNKQSVIWTPKVQQLNRLTEAGGRLTYYDVRIGIRKH